MAPSASIAAVEENAQRNATGTAISAVTTDARLRPKRWLKAPTVSPPRIARDIVEDGDGRHRGVIEVMLLLQEGGIEILGAVAEEIERRHHHDGEQRQPPMSLEHRESGGGARPFPVPAWRFAHLAPDVEDQEKGGKDAHHEQAAPAQPGIEKAEHQRGGEIAGGIARLHQARDKAALLARDGFERQ